MNKKFLLAAVIVLLAAVGIYAYNKGFTSFFFNPRPSGLETGLTLNDVAEKPEEPKEEETEIPEEEAEISIVAENIQVPWEIAFLPDGSYLITERPGTLLRIKDGESARITIADVVHRGEGGLLGLALHPEFAANSLVYIYYTAQSGNNLINRVERHAFDLEENALQEKIVIIDNIPGASFHDGGRIAFGPDGYLYITTGDAGVPSNAQDKSSLAGKILRLKDDGTVPDDNPFASPVFSYGHRNPQGLDWDAAGQLWTTDHGPSGAETGHDEINLIIKGGNYGWPLVRGDETGTGLIGPVIHSGRDETWAPAGLAIAGDKLLFTGLRGEALYSAQIKNGALAGLKTNFRGDFGRLRFVREHDGSLYLGTNNTDGRGSTRPGDDKIIKIPASLLND